MHQGFMVPGSKRSFLATLLVGALALIGLVCLLQPVIPQQPLIFASAAQAEAYLDLAMTAENLDMEPEEVISLVLETCCEGPVDLCNKDELDNRLCSDEYPDPPLIGAAFLPYAPAARLAPSPRAVPEMMARTAPASPTKPVVPRKPRPLSPGSNYPTTKNIQTQRNGFGTFVQKFQTVDKKSKYGVPIFLPDGNVNPAYLRAERAEMAKMKKKNIAAAEAKRKRLITEGNFELSSFIRKKIGEVGSGKEYYQSGK